MANTSRRSYTGDYDVNATSSTADATISVNTRPPKRARYSYGSKYRQKAKNLQPFLGFEDENLKPAIRGSLNLDERFFPYGIQPGNIIEVKGLERTGKSFLLTYFIARALIVHPDKKVLLVDTRHKFNVKNFTSIVCYFDKCICPKLGKTHEERQENLSRPLPTLLEEYPQILEYLDRVQVLPCHSPEDLMMIFGPPGESFVQDMLLKDENICLIAVDAIDNYSYSDSMKTSSWADEWPNIMQILRSSVSNTRCPVICTTLVPVEKHVYAIKRTSAPSRCQGHGCSIPSGSKGSIEKPAVPSSTSNDSPGVLSLNVSEAVKIQTHQKKALDRKYVSNFSIDYTVFTHILELTPLSNAKKDLLAHPKVKNINHCVEAYLRSRHNANTAGSGGNQRVKFSIFSDMLWII